MDARSETILPGIACLAFVLDELGIRKNKKSKYEKIEWRWDTEIDARSWLQEMVRINTYLCNGKPEEVHCERLAAHINQTIERLGREFRELRLAKAYADFAQGRFAPELARLQRFHAATGRRKRGRGNTTTSQPYR